MDSFEELERSELRRLARRKRPPCPSCGSNDVAPIVWGLPTSITMEAAKRGDVYIGGCLVSDQEWFCRRCQTGWPPAERFGGEEWLHAEPR